MIEKWEGVGGGDMSKEEGGDGGSWTGRRTSAEFNSRRNIFVKASKVNIPHAFSSSSSSVISPTSPSGQLSNSKSKIT